MRALFVNENLGGHATMHLHLARALAERDDIQAEFLHVPAPSFGRRVVGASVPGLGRLDADLQPLRAKLAAAHWVRRHLKERVARADVVHFYSQNSALLALDHLDGTPWMVSTDSTNEFNGITLPYRPPGRYTPATIALTRRFEDPVIARAHRVVAQSAWVAQALRDDYGRTDDIPVIPFGIMAPDTPTSWSKPPTPVIAFVGNALAPKGGDALLRAFSRLRQPAELVLVTREQVAPRPGLTVVNDLRPGDPRLGEILSRTTVLAIPSKTDTFGYATLEAMSHGVPVIASSIGAHGELVSDGESGFVIGPDDEGALLTALETVLADPVRAAAMGAAGRERYAARFDARTTTAQLVDVLHEVVASSASSSR